jgi:ribonuclease T1
VTVAEVTTDPDTLRPQLARYTVTLTVDGAVAGEVTYEWSFHGPSCDGSTTVGELAAAAEASAPPTAPAGPDVFVPAGFATVTLDELPPEALDTLALIDSGGPFPYDQDGSVFGNFEGLLPDRQRGYYREYTVETPGSDDRGARRIVTGDDGEIYYTDDHYASFAVVLR